MSWFGIQDVERARRRALALAGNGFPARRAVGAAVWAGGVRVQLRARRALTARQRALVSAWHAGVRAHLGLADARRRLAALGPTTSGRPPTPPSAPPSSTPARRPAVLPERLVVALEVFIVLFDFGFWFNTWSQSIEPDVAWFDQQRLSVALLALTVPVLAVVGARLAGGLTHRVLTGQDGRFERMGAVAGLVLAAAAVTVVFVLARWNFAEGGALPVVVAVPPTAMATVFALVIVLDVLVRTFGVAEVEAVAERDRRRRQRHEREVDRRFARLSAAEARIVTAWLRLRTEVQVLLERVALVTVTGDLLVLDAAVAAGSADPAAGGAGGVDAAAPAAAPAHAGGEGSGYRLPGTVRQHALHGDHHVPFELRLVADAVDVLAHHQPGTPGSWSDEVVELMRRLAELGGGLPSADRSVNGHRAPLPAAGWVGGPA